jgi:hypothetical protein
MICPRCQSRNELGVSQCGNCGAPFTRRAARRARPEQGAPRQDYNYHQQTAQSVAAPGHQHGAYYPTRRPRRAHRRNVGPGNRAVGGLIAFLIVTIVVISGAALLGTGNTADRISDGISESFSGMVDFGSDDGEPDIEIPEAPAEPQGEETWVVTEDELNRRISNQPDAFSPASDVRLELGEGTVTVRFRAYGASGTYHGSLTTRDGVPVIADSRIDGALGFVVSSGQIDEELNREMAAIVTEQNVSVESVHVRPGEMVFGIS